MLDTQPSRFSSFMTDILGLSVFIQRLKYDYFISSFKLLF